MTSEPDASFPPDGTPEFRLGDDAAQFGRCDGPVRYFVVVQALDDGTGGMSGILWCGIEENAVGFDGLEGAERATAGWHGRLRSGIGIGSSGDALFDWIWKKGVESSMTYDVGAVRTAPTREIAVQDALSNPFASGDDD